MITPGPWIVEHGGFVGGPVGYGYVCQMWNKFEEDFRNAEDNALLIAAAPDLLKALQSVRRSILSEIRRGGGVFSDKQLAMVTAAIRKAKEGA